VPLLDGGGNVLAVVTGQHGTGIDGTHGMGGTCKSNVDETILIYIDLMKIQ